MICRADTAGLPYFFVAKRTLRLFEWWCGRARSLVLMVSMSLWPPHCLSLWLMVWRHEIQFWPMVYKGQPAGPSRGECPPWKDREWKGNALSGKGILLCISSWSIILRLTKAASSSSEDKEWITYVSAILAQIFCYCSPKYPTQRVDCYLYAWISKCERGKLIFNKLFLLNINGK